MISKTLENSTDFDFLLYMAVQGLDPLTYFDVNRIHKLKDKTESNEVRQ